MATAKPTGVLWRSTIHDAPAKLAFRQKSERLTGSASAPRSDAPSARTISSARSRSDGNASRARNPSGSKFLTVRHRFERHMHAGTFVQACGARRILGVDAERNAALASPVELAERVVEQRLRDAATAPGLADAQRADEAGGREIGFVAHERRDHAAGPGREPQGRGVV